MTLCDISNNFFLDQLKVPDIATGITGISVFMAKIAAPFLNVKSSPSLVLVPSGKIATDLGIFFISSIRLFIDFTALSLFFLSTKMKPAISKIDLKIGILLSSFFAINTVYLFTAINRRGISIKEA